MECVCAALYRVTSEAVSRKLRRTCVLHMQWCLPLGGDAHEGFSNGAELRCLSYAASEKVLQRLRAEDISRGLRAARACSTRSGACPWMVLPVRGSPVAYSCAACLTRPLTKFSKGCVLHVKRSCKLMSTKGLMSPSLMREGEGAGALCV